MKPLLPAVGGISLRSSERTTSTSLPNSGTWMIPCCKTTLSVGLWLRRRQLGPASAASATAGQYNDGTTTDLVAQTSKAVFTMFFGSWLGDWDSEDNIMRGVLAQPAKG